MFHLLTYHARRVFLSNILCFEFSCIRSLSFNASMMRHRREIPKNTTPLINQSVLSQSLMTKGRRIPHDRFRIHTKKSRNGAIMRMNSITEHMNIFPYCLLLFVRRYETQIFPFDVLYYLRLVLKIGTMDNSLKLHK